MKVCIDEESDVCESKSKRFKKTWVLQMRWNRDDRNHLSEMFFSAYYDWHGIGKYVNKKDAEQALAKHLFDNLRGDSFRVIRIGNL